MSMTQSTVMYVLHVHVHEQFQCIRDHKKKGKVSKKSAYMYMYTCMSQVAHQVSISPVYLIIYIYLLFIYFKICIYKVYTGVRTKGHNILYKVQPPY